MTRLLGHRLSHIVYTYYVHTYVDCTYVCRSSGAACLRVQIRFAHGSQFSRNRTLRRDRHTTVCTHRYRPMRADTEKRNNAWKGRPRNAFARSFRGEVALRHARRKLAQWARRMARVANWEDYSPVLFSRHLELHCDTKFSIFCEIEKAF